MCKDRNSKRKEERQETRRFIADFAHCHNPEQTDNRHGQEKAERRCKEMQKTDPSKLKSPTNNGKPHTENYEGNVSIRCVMEKTHRLHVDGL
jgi:hypothetical protein